MNQINRLGPGKKTNAWLYVAVEEGEEEKVKNTKKKLVNFIALSQLRHFKFQSGMIDRTS